MFCLFAVYCSQITNTKTTKAMSKAIKNKLVGLQIEVSSIHYKTCILTYLHTWNGTDVYTGKTSRPRGKKQYHTYLYHSANTLSLRVQEGANTVNLEANQFTYKVGEQTPPEPQKNHIPKIEGFNFRRANIFTIRKHRI